MTAILATTVPPIAIAASALPIAAGGLPEAAIGAKLAAIAIGGTVVANMAVKIGVTLAYARAKGMSAAVALGASTLALIASLAVAWAKL